VPTAIDLRSRPPTVAVVDDHASLREAIASLLHSAGYRVQAFISAEHFLLSAGEERVACLVLDAKLPGMSGPQLQRHLARRGKLLPIVFVSAHADSDARLQARALQGGALAFLRKPFRDADLLAAVELALDLSV
jgi:FixJ family two-component response regulator